MNNKDGIKMFKDTSQIFNERIVEPGRTFRGYLHIGETILEGINSIKIINGSNSGDSISIGNTFSQSVEIEMDKPDINLYGKEFALKLRLYLSETETEEIPMGIFIPDIITEKDGKIKFTAYDRMVLLAMDYLSQLPDLTDTVSVLKEITEITKVSIDTEGLEPISMKRPIGYTCRQVLSHVAQLYGKSANVNRAGMIELHFWEDSGYVLTADQGINGFSFSTPYTVEKIVCTVGSDEDGQSVIISAGEGISGINISNPYMTRERIDAIYGEIGGFTYDPVECPVILGDPRLDPWDLISIQDVKGNEYKVPLMSLAYNFDGGLDMTIVSIASSGTDDETGYTGPMEAFEKRILESMAGVKGKDGRVYILDASDVIVKMDDVGELTPNVLTFYAYSRAGEEKREPYAGRFRIKQSADGETWNTAYESARDETSITYALYEFLADDEGNALTDENGNALRVDGDVSHVEATLYAAGSFEEELERRQAVIIRDVDALSPDEVFNLLTNNGEIQGFLKQGNKIYVNVEYLYGKKIAAELINVPAIFAEDITATGTITGLDIKGATGSFKERLEIETNTDSMVTFYANEDTFAVEYGASDDQGKGYGSLMIGRYGSELVCMNAIIGLDNGNISLGGKEIVVSGDFRVTGKKNRVVETKTYSDRLLNCYEMSSPMFGDIGSGRTDENGICVVSIDPIFMETLAAGVEYHVFLQKEAEGDLWVAERRSDYFIVRGSANIPFSWEMKAYQRGYEMVRMEEPGTAMDIPETDDLTEIFNKELRNIEKEMEEMRYAEYSQSVSGTKPGRGEDGISYIQ